MPSVWLGLHCRRHSGMVPTGRRFAPPDERLRTRPQMCNAHRGIHGLRVHASRTPERQAERARSQPPFPSLKTLQVLEALALVAGAAEIKLLGIFVVAHFAGAAVAHHLAWLHDVAVA